MLSYMLPIDENKPPPGPSPKTHMQLSLGNGSGGSDNSRGEPLTNGNNRTSSPIISKDTSVSSFISDVTTATASHGSMTPSSTSDKGKPKLIINGGKHQTLKRVSFGSSKGSMVETLIFESPVQEEPEPSPIPENGHPFPEDHEQTETEREKVRVTFFQQSKPQEVDLPDEPVVFQDTDFVMATPSVNDSNHVVYNRTESTESGWDNPFRPGGDLSREADEIVELIKGGKPITPTPGSQAPQIPSLDDTIDHSTPKKLSDLNASPPAKSANGNVNNKNNDNGKAAQQQQPGAVNVKHGTIKPEGGDASQVERVTIKKKPKCKCCVIQ